MEHKWAIYHHAGKLMFIRSWMRRVHVLADVKQEDDAVHVTKIEWQNRGLANTVVQPSKAAAGLFKPRLAQSPYLPYYYL